MGSNQNLEHVGSLNPNSGAVSIQKVVVGEMASTDHPCTGVGGGETPLVTRNDTYPLDDVSSSC